MASAPTAGDRIADAGLRSLKPLPGKSEENEVMAAVYRHIISRNLDRLATPPKCFFLATGKHGQLFEPPPELLAKLKGEPTPVKSIAAAGLEGGKYVDGGAHDLAPVVQLLPIEWQEDRATVPGKIFGEPGDLNFVETYYVVERRNGKWVVLGYRGGF